MKQTHFYTSTIDNENRIEELKLIRHKNNKTLWVLLFILTVSCLWRYVSYQIRINKNFEIIEGSSQTLPNVVNPNTASWASLARLPGIGQTKAKAIITYRKTFHKNHTKEQLAFETPDDLTTVKGIGPATVEKIRTFISCHDDLVSKDIKNENRSE